jgi:hypothetical protein
VPKETLPDIDDDEVEELRNGSKLKAWLMYSRRTGVAEAAALPYIRQKWSDMHGPHPQTARGRV